MPFDLWAVTALLPDAPKGVALGDELGYESPPHVVALPATAKRAGNVAEVDGGEAGFYVDGTTWYVAGAAFSGAGVVVETLIAKADGKQYNQPGINPPPIGATVDASGSKNYLPPPAGDGGLTAIVIITVLLVALAVGGYLYINAKEVQS